MSAHLAGGPDAA